MEFPKTTFLIVRHPEVNKKHPLGEAAPLTSEGAGQAVALANYFWSHGVKLVIIPTVGLPRFDQTANEMEKVGLMVQRVDGISFKEDKGKLPLRQIIAKYREAGQNILKTMMVKEETPNIVGIVGSFPLVSGMRLDPETATDDELANQPGFCTGLVIEMADDGTLKITEPNFRPVG